MNKQEYNILEAIDQMINHNKIIISATTGQRFFTLGWATGIYCQDSDGDNEILLGEDDEVFSLEEVIGKWYIE